MSKRKIIWVSAGLAVLLIMVALVIYYFSSPQLENTTKLPQPVNELKDVKFPACYKNCGAAHYFGVSECGGICPEKFRGDIK